LFIGFSTYKGFASATGPTDSPFSAILTSLFENNYQQMHLAEMFTMVQNKVADKITKVRDEDGAKSSMQMPELRSTFRKKLYFLSEGILQSTIAIYCCQSKNNSSITSIDSFSDKMRNLSGLITIFNTIKKQNRKSFWSLIKIQ